MDNINPETFNTKSAQLQQFSNLLGSRDQTYFTSTSFLARGHLAPDADFIFGSTQFATYFYLNTCPQFQSVNAGNWLRVETLARNLATQEKRDLVVYTGGYQHLELLDTNGALQKLYLSPDKKIIVPKWIWKIVQNQKTDAAIVFITLNNPFAQQSDVARLLCNNVCQEADISIAQFDNLSKGFTYCCGLNEFKQVLGAVLPANVTASSLLKFKKK